MHVCVLTFVYSKKYIFWFKKRRTNLRPKNIRKAKQINYTRKAKAKKRRRSGIHIAKYKRKVLDARIWSGKKGEESQWMQSENEDIIIAIGITIYYPQWYYLSKWRPGTQSLLDEAAFASLKQLLVVCFFERKIYKHILRKCNQMKSYSFCLIQKVTKRVNLSCRI